MNLFITRPVDLSNTAIGGKSRENKDVRSTPPRQIFGTPLCLDCRFLGERRPEPVDVIGSNIYLLTNCSSNLDQISEDVNAFQNSVTG
jgi:hypothetical protein